MNYLTKLAFLAFAFSSVNCFAEIDAARIKRDVDVMSGAIPQPVIFNNQNRSFRDKGNPEYEYRDADNEPMSRYQYQDDLLIMMHEATKIASDKLAFEKELLKNIESVEDANTKCELIRMLEIAGSDESLKLLKKIALSDNETYALVATGALQKLNSSKASDTLIECFKSAKNPKVKQLALYALAKRGEKKQFIAKMKTDKTFGEVALNGSNTLIPTDLDKFKADFNQKPSATKASQAIKNGNEWEVLAVVNYVFTKENSLIPELQERYNNASIELKAWIIEEAGKNVNDASKAFIVKNANEAKDGYVCMACAFVFEKIGDKDAAIEMFKLHHKTRDHYQACIDWAIDRLAKNSKEIDEYIVSQAKEGDGNAIRFIGRRGIYNAKSILFEKLNSPAWQDVLKAYENIGDDADIYAILKFIDKEKSNDKHFVYRFAFVVRNVITHSSDASKMLSTIKEASKKQCESQNDMIKCYYLALLEAGSPDDLITLAKSVADGSSDKAGISQLAPFAKRLSSGWWKRMPNHEKYEAEMKNIIANAKCDEQSKTALEKALGYIHNHGDEPKK